jgi:hypothetical protein
LLQENEEQAVSFCFFDVLRALLPVGPPCAVASAKPVSAAKEESTSICFIDALRGLFNSSSQSALAKNGVVIEELDTEDDEDLEEQAGKDVEEVAGYRVEGVAKPTPMVIVTVRDVDGASLLGPAQFEPSLTVAELGDQVLAKTGDGEVCTVEIRHSSEILDRSTHLQEVQGTESSNRLELTAVFQNSELSEWRRQRYIEALGDFWRQLRVRPQELLQFPLPFRADPACMLAAIRKTGNEALLEHAHIRLLADKQFMMAAVRERGCALRYAARALKEDAEIVREATRQNRDALRYAYQTFGSAPPRACGRASGGKAAPFIHSLPKHAMKTR